MDAAELEVGEDHVAVKGRGGDGGALGLRVEGTLVASESC